MNGQRSVSTDHFVEITRPNDHLLEDFWLPLYRRAFSEDERVPEEENRAAAAAADQHLLVGLDGDRAVSMARYDVSFVHVGLAYGYLMYMAVDEASTSRGHGQQMFGTIVTRLEVDPHHPALMLLEVERPELSRATERHQSAERRIDFYRKQGCFVLGGVEYLQRVPGQEPVPMLIMARRLTSGATIDDVFAAARDAFEDDVTKTGTLAEV